MWKFKTLFTIFLIQWICFFSNAQSVSYSSHNSVHTYKSKDSFSSYEIQHKGKIEVTENDQAIKSISSGGFLKVSKTTFGNKRAIVIESTSSGNLQYTYYVGKKATPFTPEGKAWLADIMLDVIRKTGISAESRANRIYKKSGVDGVIEEISEIESSRVKSRYFEALLGNSNINNKGLATIAKSIGTSISSSSERGRLYRKFSSKFFNNDEVAIAYFEGVGRISSSSEKGSILRHVLKLHKLSDNMMVGLLEACTRISSSSEKGSVLREVNDLFSNNEKVIEAYFEAVDNISSSSERGSVLRGLLKNNQLNGPAMSALLKSTGNISSTSEKGSVLRLVLEHPLPNNETAYKEFFKIADRISSSSEKGSVMRKFLGNTELSSSNVGVWFYESTASISSDSERGSVLRASYEYLGKYTEVDKEFFQTVKSISSSSEKAYVLRKLLNNKDNISESLLLGIIETIPNISSSSEKSRLLIDVIEVMPKNNQKIKDEVLSAAKTISSDSEYRRIMEKIHNLE